MAYQEEPKVRPPGIPSDWHWNSIMQKYCAGPSAKERESSPRLRCGTLMVNLNEQRALEGLPALPLEDLWEPSPGAPQL